MFKRFQREQSNRRLVPLGPALPGFDPVTKPMPGFDLTPLLQMGEGLTDRFTADLQRIGQRAFRREQPYLCLAANFLRDPLCHLCRQGLITLWIRRHDPEQGDGALGRQFIFALGFVGLVSEGNQVDLLGARTESFMCCCPSRLS
jgi:hypothetical protein